MANNLGSLVVSLGLDAAEFTRGLGKAEYQAQAWARTLDNAILAARNSAATAFAAIGAGAVVLNGQIESIAGFQDLAEKIGDTATAVASLKPAADVSGVSLETFASASVKLTSALSKIDDESKGAGLALEAIGLGVEDFKNLSPVEQFDAVATALRGFEDGAGKTAVAVQLFGKSGADLIPMLNDLADGAERQTRLTEDQIKAADDYSKSTARLRGDLQSLGQGIAADLVPNMQGLADLLRVVLDESKGAADGTGVLTGALDGARVVLQTVVVLASDVAFVFKQTGNEIGGMAAQLAALAQLDLQGFTAISDAMRADAQKARAELDSFQRRVLATPVKYAADDQSGAEARRLGLAGAPLRKINTDGFGSAGSGKAGGTGGGKAGKPPRDDAAEKYIESLEKQMLQVQQLSRQEEVLADIQAGRLGKLTAQQQDQALNLAGLIDYLGAEKRLTDEMAQAEKARFEAQDAYYETYWEWLDKVKANTETGRLEAQRAEVEKLTEAFQKGDLSEQQYLEATTDLLGLKNKELKDTKTFADELGLSFASAFEDGIVNGEKFGDVLDGLIKDLARMVIRDQVTKPLANLAGSFLNGLSFDGGGYTGSGSRAGGLDGKGGFLAMMHPNETVLDHTRGQGGGGGGAVSVSYSIDARGADAGVEQRLRAAMAESEARLRSQVVPMVVAAANRGGSTARALGRA